VTPEPGVSRSEAIKALESSPGVLYAEPDRIRRASVTPNDSLFGMEWGMNNTGQTVSGTAGTADADIDATEAWGVTTGSSAITVGIADSGVDMAHPDLSPNIWTNPNETANGADDDGNGLVDDLHGWDWVDGDSNPTDLNGHGTHVSGTVGARGNDSTGVAGVSWRESLVPLRVLGASGSGTVSDLIKADTYAGQKGLRVVNESLGSGGSSTSERQAMAAASNTLFVVAAGNGALNNDASPTYPCNYDLPNLICVAATDQNDQLATFSTGGSNYGATSVDLGAPGKNIASSWAASQCGAVTPPCWATSSGTSMATPHVAGAAALVLAAHPEYTVAQLRQALLGSVDPDPALAGKTVTGGRLNVFAALGAPVPSGAGGGGTPSGGGATSNPVVQAPAPKKTASVVPAADRTAPTVGLTIKRQGLRSVLRRGLRVRVRSSEAASLRLDLVLASRSMAARRVLAARYLLLGRARDSLSGAGSLTRPVGLSTRARRGLRELRRVTLRLRVRAVDRKGNARTVSRLLVLR
jgi:subtilisin family serine protease